MSEIEKLYKNTGVERVIPDVCSNYEGDCIGCKAYIKGHKPYCTEAEYPLFTAEKQLSLIKWLCKNTYRNYLMIRYNFTNYYWQIECNMVDSNKTDKFSECIASIVNNLWQDLTETEQEQIRSILNGK